MEAPESPNPYAAVVASCTCLNLKRAARAAAHILDSYLHPLGLRASQFVLLTAILRAESATITGLADDLVNDRTTLTRTLKPLQRDGLVLVAAGQDRRVREISITPKGHALWEQAKPLWEAAEARIREQLGTQRWHDLLDNAGAMAALGQNVS